MTCDRKVICFQLGFGSSQYCSELKSAFSLGLGGSFNGHIGAWGIGYLARGYRVMERIHRV